MKVKIYSSGEDFVETHLCKLCVLLRSRVLRVSCFSVESSVDVSGEVVFVESFVESSVEVASVEASV